jgi:uncharacterized protein
MDAAPERPKLDRLAVILRLGVYLFLAIIGMSFLPWILEPSGKLITATMSTFAAAAVANAAVLRIYERGQLADIGLGWNAASRRNLLIGLAGGIGSGVAVLLVPVALRVADVVPAATPFNAGAVLFVSVVLLFGAVGEEMLFRGYAFQLLVGYIGPWATILPFAILFAFAHLANPNQNAIVGPLNTALWGIVLGYAFLRSHDLWLPIGIHFGWNWVLPLFGVNLSGFTMGVSGVEMRWRVSDLWSGGQYGPEGGLVTTLVLCALTYYLHRAPVGKQVAFLIEPDESAV